MIRILKIFLSLLGFAIITGTFYMLQSSKPQQQSDIISIAAPEIGERAHVLLPNLSNARIVVPDRPHSPTEVFHKDKAQLIQRTRTFYASTNSLGFRNPELLPKTKTRIICLGDSVTFGWGVSDHETYPALLQEKQQEIEVINVGVPALKPEHINDYFQQKIARLDGDIILVAMRPNWMRPQALQEYSHAIQQLAQQSQKPIGIILPPLSLFDINGRQDNARELQEIRRNLPQFPLLDLTPIFDQHRTTKGISLDIVNDEQRLLDSQHNILARGVSNSPQSLAPEIIFAFEHDHDIKEELFFDGGHPDKEGFVIFADAVAQWLETWSETN